MSDDHQRTVKLADSPQDDIVPDAYSQSTSYVYPVRSLLSGKIQPAAADAMRPPLMMKAHSSDNITGVAASSRIYGKSAGGLRANVQSWSNEVTNASSKSESRRAKAPKITAEEMKALSQAASSTSGLNSAETEFSLSPGAESFHTRMKRRSKKVLSPNYRHFPAEDNPYFPRTFVSSTASSKSSPLNGGIDTFASVADSLAGAFSNTYTESDKSEEEDGISRFADSVSDLPLNALPGGEPRLPFNPSEYGLVHLPPLPPSVSSGTSKFNPSSAGSGSRRAALSSAGSLPRRPQLSSEHNSAPFLSSSSNDYKSARASPEPYLSIPESTVSSVGSQDASSSNGSGENGPVMTFKFENRVDDNGNHIIIGREGKLMRCEDEPIRTPGAVQGFGVLIVVDENVENETLTVRQVSENASEILGLSPRYLFSLECFTDALPDAQAGILWDNIESIGETGSDAELRDKDGGPHIFTLSGLGEPGSAGENDAESNEGKRSWSCWCAVHRPPIGREWLGGSNLIIMEFELERDVYNPLYPPIPASASHETETISPTPGSDSSAQMTPIGDVSESGSGTCPVTAHSSSTAMPQVATPTPSVPPDSSSPRVLQQNIVGGGDTIFEPTAENILDSTTSRSKPLMALERLRKMSRPVLGGTSAPSKTRRKKRSTSNSGSVGMMDVFAVMAQINEQLGDAPDLDSFLKVVVGVIKDLTQFHRVLVYQFDEAWNGQVVAELVDWSVSHDLYSGLHFPASDIPAQARELYCINKVRILYDRAQTTARIVARNKGDLEPPLNMTHCYLRAMSPIHIKYLENMGVRASMSISIMAFGKLWGLVSCHGYGSHGMRVSFPVRQMLRLLSQAISRNIERLSYAQRLHTRKLINTITSDNHPTGYIVSNADDLLSLFDADFGILVISEGAKIIGPNLHGQEILVMAEYLRLKQFTSIQASQEVVNDFPDLKLSTGLEVIAGLLYVPLSTGGRDFIAFLRKGQPRNVRWAGRPQKQQQALEGGEEYLRPRTSFKTWSETVTGRSRIWTDEQLETAGVLALVYGKFIEVWRQKETAMKSTRLANLLLSNATHEVRTPLNHIINYLELALSGPLDIETRENLSRSHTASKSLLFTINDLLDLTRLESGNETSFNELFDLHLAITDATLVYRNEASRRKLGFEIDVSGCPNFVIGDAKKVQTVISNLTANALKYTQKGSIFVKCQTCAEPGGSCGPRQSAIEVMVADTGCGIPKEKLESIFREFEQVESAGPKSSAAEGVGLGLAVVARIVKQLGGQLRVDSVVDEGSRFSFLIPVSLTSTSELSLSPQRSNKTSIHSGSIHSGSLENIPGGSVGLGSAGTGSEIDLIVEALGSQRPSTPASQLPQTLTKSEPRTPGLYGITGSQVPIRAVRLDDKDADVRSSPFDHSRSPKKSSLVEVPQTGGAGQKLRILIVEDNEINRKILTKRLVLDGHVVVGTTNGQEGLDTVDGDRSFDCVLMDIQMPILDGYQATERIRDLERSSSPIMDEHPEPDHPAPRLSHKLNGRLPIFAVSASLFEQHREKILSHGIDGWILKPIDFKRLRQILAGVTDPVQRDKDVYGPGASWELGGWLTKRPGRRSSRTRLASGSEHKL